MVFVAVFYFSQIGIYDGRHGCGGHDKTIVVLSEGQSIANTIGRIIAKNSFYLVHSSHHWIKHHIVSKQL